MASSTSPSEPSHRNSKTNNRLDRPSDELTEFAIPPRIPFAWQHGLRLLLMDEEPEGWVVAELAFSPEVCRYAEVRRAQFDWEREAVGSLMSRALASGEGALEDAAISINQWLVENYGHTIDDTPARPTYRFPIHLS